MHPLIVLGERHVVLDGRSISYTLKRSPRARYVRLEIRENDGLAVIVPRRYDLRHLDEVLHRRARWILTKIEDCASRVGQQESRLLADGDSLRYLDWTLRLHITEGDGNRGAVSIRGDELLVVAPLNRADGGHLVEKWYRYQADTFIKARVDLLASKLGVQYGRITIRGQQTRWASCSPKGNLSFNWRLIMAPEQVVDYVIIHELTHLKEMNHTSKFWALVAGRCPTWKENRRWLSEHGSELSAISLRLA